MEIHIVAAGETILKLSQIYNISPERIISDNGLLPPYVLVVGQALIITKPETIHYVKPGDTLYSIAVKYGITLQELYQNNPELTQYEPLSENQILVISFEGEKRRTISINGYAYPFVNQELLRRTLPFLTFLSIFSYGMKEDGTLLIPDDSLLLEEAKAFQALPVLVLTSLTEEDVFSHERLKKLILDPEYQNSILNQLIEIMLKKGYRGLDADFEFIPKEDSYAYFAFLENAKKRLHAQGLFLHTALAPKTSATQPGLLYEGHNYAKMGEICDRVLLMTYEWGYKYGPPLAVAPIPQVEKVVQYAVSVIPPEKIFMGIPNYAYDWTLPYVPKVSEAVTIGNQWAVKIAAENQAEIQYDEVAQSPFFYYSKDNKEHVVWFEDVRSIEAKFNLLDNYNLLGPGYWNVMRPFAQNWAFISTQYHVKKYLY